LKVGQTGSVGRFKRGEGGVKGAYFKTKGQKKSRQTTKADKGGISIKEGATGVSAKKRSLGGGHSQGRKQVRKYHVL